MNNTYQGVYTDIATEGVEQHLAQKHNGNVFEHVWLHRVGDGWAVKKDLYAIIDGVVYELNGDRKTPTGDTLLQTVNECVCVGDYNQSLQYQRSQQVISHTDLKTILRLG